MKEKKKEKFDLRAQSLEVESMEERNNLDLPPDCFGTFGTAGTLGGCASFFGTFGCC